MTMILLGLGALLVSAIPILILCMGDPKRRRAGGERGGMASGRRRLLVAVACVPGVICAFLGDSAAFLMWLGGCALVGWALATGFRPLRRH